MSTFPRIIFNVLQSSVRRGLADDGTRKVGPVALEGEFGPLFNFSGQSEWLYELSAGSRDLTANVGLRQTLSKRASSFAR